MRPVRRSGVLLHPTSLPGPGGIGSLGAAARCFVDFLHDAGQSLWQVLPLGPTGFGNSPYSCYSAFAGNPLLIDLAQLVEEGDLEPGEISSLPDPHGPVDFVAVAATKLPLLRRAADRFLAGGDPNRTEEFWRFCDATGWLHDYALFMACKEHFHGKGWSHWPSDLTQRTREAYENYSEKLGHVIGVEKYIQWQFSRQWHALRAYANLRGVLLIGDAPIFVAYDSADVWCNQHLFWLDEKGSPTVVAGVPPDYFSKTGQRWGNPLYRWERMTAEGFAWWIARMRNDLGLYDIVRIDHFRGFEGFWEIPAREKTAVMGRWAKGPGGSFFTALESSLGHLPLIAEDLGVITPEVEALRDRFGFPGMKILQFAFDSGPANSYLPHNYEPNCVVYTGTHDNDTTQGWWESRGEKERSRVLHYLRTDNREVVWDLIACALASVARWAVIPAQDLLMLGGSDRMNLPGNAQGNWGWRLSAGALTEGVGQRLRELTVLYGRKVGK